MRLCRLSWEQRLAATEDRAKAPSRFLRLGGQPSAVASGSHPRAGEVGMAGFILGPLLPRALRCSIACVHVDDFLIAGDRQSPTYVVAREAREEASTWDAGNRANLSLPGAIWSNARMEGQDTYTGKWIEDRGGRESKGPGCSEEQPFEPRGGEHSSSRAGNFGLALCADVLRWALTERRAESQSGHPFVSQQACTRSSPQHRAGPDVPVKRNKREHERIAQEILENFLRALQHFAAEQLLPWGSESPEAKGRQSTAASHLTCHACPLFTSAD